MSRHSRPTEWLGAQHDNLSSGGFVVGFRTLVAQQVFRDRFQAPTIVRLEGCINSQMVRTAPDNPPTTNYQVGYQMGVIVIADALAGSSTNPATDTGQELPWLWTCSGRMTVASEFRVNGFTGATYLAALSGERTQFHHLSSRANRKVRPGEGLRLAWSVFNIASSQADGVEWTFNVRILVKS